MGIERNWEIPSRHVTAQEMAQSVTSIHGAGNKASRSALFVSPQWLVFHYIIWKKNMLKVKRVEFMTWKFDTVSSYDFWTLPLWGLSENVLTLVQFSDPVEDMLIRWERDQGIYSVKRRKESTLPPAYPLTPLFQTSGKCQQQQWKQLPPPLPEW